MSVHTEFLAPGDAIRGDDSVLIARMGPDPAELLPGTPAALIFVPYPSIGSTQLALEAGRAAHGNDIHTVAVAEVPADIFDHNLNPQTCELELDAGGEGSKVTNLLLAQQLRETGIEPAAVHHDSAYVDTTLFVRSGTAPGDVAEALQHLQLDFKGVYPNITAWNERYVARVIEELGDAYVLKYPSVAAVDLGVDKVAFNAFQAELGLRAPIELTYGYTEDLRQDVEAVFRNVREIYAQKGKPAVLKFINGTGSSGVVILNPGVQTEAALRSDIEQHLRLGRETGTTASTTQEFMQGREVGAHAFMRNGKLQVLYTRKGMAVGADGRNREEIWHEYDPDDPLHELCDRVVTPKLRLLLAAMEVKDGHANFDIIVDPGYFDRNGKVASMKQLQTETDDTCIIEAHIGRPGGVAVQKMLSRALRFDAYELSFGQSRLAGRLRRPQQGIHKKAARVETLFPDHAGHVVVPPFYEYLQPDGVFYSSADRWRPASSALTEGDYISPIADWRTKGKRPVIGIEGKDYEHMMTRRNRAIASVGMVVLTKEGLAHFDEHKGEYVVAPIEPGSSNYRRLVRKGYEEGPSGWTKE